MTAPLLPPSGPSAPVAPGHPRAEERSGAPEGEDTDGAGPTDWDDPQLAAAVARHPASRRPEVLRLPEPRT